MTARNDSSSPQSRAEADENDEFKRQRAEIHRRANEAYQRYRKRFKGMFDIIAATYPEMAAKVAAECPPETPEEEERRKHEALELVMGKRHLGPLGQSHPPAKKAKPKIELPKLTEPKVGSFSPVYMSATLPREEILARNPLLNYCTEHGIELRKSGSGWIGLCPIHDDKKPSFTVGPNPNVWYCHSCRRGGSVVDLHAALHNLTIKEALRDLRGGSAADSRKEKLGEEIASWRYTDADGFNLFDVVKFRPKTFRPFKVDEFGERAKYPGIEGVRLVPYNLPAVIRAEEIVICEGEKDADTLTRIGRVATTNPFGAKKWRSEFNGFFYGKQVVIVPDNDKAGGEHAQQVASALFDVASRVSIVELPDGIKDVSDLAVARGETFANEFAELLKSAHEFIHGDNGEEGQQVHDSPSRQRGQQKQALDEWPEPQTLEEYLRPVEQPPLDKMPEIVGEWIEDIAHHRRCAPDFPAAAAIVLFSSVTGTRFRICINHENHEWEEAPNLWGMILGPPGSKKTPAMDAVFSQLTRLMIEESAKFKEVAKKFELKKADHDDEAKTLNKEISRLRNHCLKAKGDEKQRNEERLEELKYKLEELMMSEPEAPVERVFFLNDSTTAALENALSKDQNCLLFARDEMTGLLQQLEMKNFEDLRQFFLESWNGKHPYKGLRMSRGEFFIACLCLSLFGGIQPAIFVQYLRDPNTNLSADGMLHRFQASVYPNIPPMRRHVDEPANVEAKNRCFFILRQLAFADVRTAFGAHEPNEYNKVAWLQFDIEAKKLWEEWLYVNELKVRESKETNMMREHLSKYPKLFCALAALFHVIDLADDEKGDRLKDQREKGIPKHCVEWAVAWCSYFESHMRRIHDMISNPSLASAIVLATKLVDASLENPLESGFTARDVRRRCWKGVETQELVASAIARLEELHWLRRVEAKLSSQGGQPADRYLINPAILKRREEGQK